MVWNPRRGGWEMPGGHCEEGETPEETAVREFMEESGYEIEIRAVRDLGHCHVCAAVLGEKTGDACEMNSEIFTDLPEVLAFPKDEYLDTVAWARSVVCSPESGDPGGNGRRRMAD